MLTHFGNFLCCIGEKGPFKTVSSLWRTALPVAFILNPTGLWDIAFVKVVTYGKSPSQQDFWG